MMECYFKVSCPSCCCGQTNHDSYHLEKAEAKSRSKEIDIKLREEKKSKKNQVKILLLGAGESGKTTFLKQMRILHGQGFDDASVSSFKHTVYKNIVQGIRVLCDARQKSEINFQYQQNIENQNILLSLPDFLPHIDENLFLGLLNSIRSLWMDGAIQAIYTCRSEYQISDAVKYFCENLDRIGLKGYEPTQLDILNARNATKGVHELNIMIDNVPFQFIDVGGQRSERNKWLQCFENVTSIVFMVASSEFDQVLKEDKVTNRLTDSMTVFTSIVNNRMFNDTSIILFLNKVDLLKEKIKTVNLSTYFETFTGDNRNLEEVQTFILNLFLDLRRPLDRSYIQRESRLDPNTTLTLQRNEKSKSELYSHYTVAIDTENIRLIFNDVKNTILKKNLQNLMLQ